MATDNAALGWLQKDKANAAGIEGGSYLCYRGLHNIIEVERVTHPGCHPVKERLAFGLLLQMLKQLSPVQDNRCLHNNRRQDSFLIGAQSGRHQQKAQAFTLILLLPDQGYNQRQRVTVPGGRLWQARDRQQHFGGTGTVGAPLSGLEVGKADRIEGGAEAIEHRLNHFRY